MFYYYGAKIMLAGRYDAPAFPTIIEPFAGSAGYSMYHLNSAERVILLEKDPRVVALWERLLSMEPEDVLALPLPEVGARTSDFLYMTAQTSSGVAVSSYVTVTPRMPKILERMLRRVARLLPEAKRKVTVIHGDYGDAPDIEATWFVDPPYFVNGSAATTTSAPQGMGYAKGCNSSEIDYALLGEWCTSRRGQIVVCEQRGATWLPFRPMYAGWNSLGRISPEVVWTSPGYGQQTFAC